MADIKTHLNNIKGALYGKDVRGSIHDGMNAINNEVESTTSRQVDLENTFDQLIINAGNSNAEIVDARVKNDGTLYSKLGDRLDAVDSQLEQNKNYLKNEINSITNIIYPSMSMTTIQNILNEKGNILFTKGIYNIEFTNINSVPTGFDIQSDTKILCENETFFIVPTNNYERYYCFNIENKSNVILDGIHIKGDRHTHTGTNGEWGYGVRVSKSNNITISNSFAENCWGDGFIVNGENIKVINCIADNNRRQGLTIANSKNVLVQNSIFKNTNGTNPEAGIDIEPDSSGLAQDCIIRDCYFYNNKGYGVNLSGIEDTYENTRVKNIQVINNIMVKNGYGIRISKAYDVVISGNVCRESTTTGIMVGASGKCIINNNECSYNKTGLHISTTKYGSNITNNVTQYNTGSGMSIATSDYNNIIGNTSRYNQSHGIILNTSSNNNVSSNYCYDNGALLTDINTSGIMITTNSKYNNIQSNKCMSINTDNYNQRYGIRVNGTSNTKCIVMNNDCMSGGTINGIITETSSTVNNGNRNNDSTWSNTPN